MQPNRPADRKEQAEPSSEAGFRNAAIRTQLNPLYDMREDTGDHSRGNLPEVVWSDESQLHWPSSSRVQCSTGLDSRTARRSSLALLLDIGLPDSNRTRTGLEPEPVQPKEAGRLPKRHVTERRGSPLDRIPLLTAASWTGPLPGSAASSWTAA